jgi:hypothetical protein
MGAVDEIVPLPQVADTAMRLAEQAGAQPLAAGR